MKRAIKNIAAAIALGMVCQIATAQLPKLNIKQLRKQAEKEYLKPVDFPFRIILFLTFCGILLGCNTTSPSQQNKITSA